MGFLDQLNSVLQQYANNSGSGQAPGQVNQHFDQVAQAAPKSLVAEGLASAFRPATRRTSDRCWGACSVSQTATKRLAS